MKAGGRAFVGGLAAVVVLAATAGFVARGFVSPTQQAAASKPPPRAVLTAPVTFGVLQSTVIFRADVTSQNPLSAAVPTSVGTDLPVVTAESGAPGRDVIDGQVVAAVANRPMFVAVGEIPTFRSLTPGEDGPDVGELQSFLHRVGLSTWNDRPAVYGAGTAAAVRAWYQRIGFDPVLDPPNADQDLAAAEHTVDHDRTVVETAQGTYDSDRANPATPASQIASDRAAIAGALQTLATDEATLSNLQSTTGAEVPLGELVFVPQLPVQLVSFAAPVGGTVGAPGGMGTANVFTLASREVSVVGGVDSLDAESLKVGLPATITSDISGQTFSSRVAGVGTQPTQQQGGQGDTYPVTVTSPQDLSGILGQNVGVRVVLSTSGSPTFQVPVAAVVTTATGSSTVVVVDGSLRTTVVVRVGISDHGTVAVTPTRGSLRVGDQVLLGIGPADGG